MAMGGSENLYVAGSFNAPSFNLGAYTITNVNLPPDPGWDIFIAKYDTNGTVVWAKSAGGSGNDFGNKISADPLGDIYLAGDFSSPTITFGATTLTNITGDDIFLTRYDTSGNPIWAKSFGVTANSSEKTFAICADDTGNVYFTASFTNPAITMGSTTFFNSDPTGATADIFLAKYNSSGSLVWVTNAGSPLGNDFVSAIATDSSGNLYATGDFLGQYIIFGATTLLDNDTSITSAENDVFLAKMSTAFNPTAGTSIIKQGQKQISVYPNPNNGQIAVTLNAEGYTALQVYDCLGRQVFTTTLTGTEKSTEINMQSAPPGMYYLHATSAAYSQSIPFVVR